MHFPELRKDCLFEMKNIVLIFSAINLRNCVSTFSYVEVLIILNESYPLSKEFSPTIGCQIPCVPYTKLESREEETRQVLGT